MIPDLRRVLFPATAYRPTAVAVLMEDSDILENRTNIVRFPNYSLDMKVTRENIRKLVPNPFGLVEVNHAIVLELDEGKVVKHVIGYEDNDSGEGLVGQDFVLDNLQGSFVSANRFLALRVSSNAAMNILGVYLVLNNGAYAWANGIIASSPVNLIRYSRGVVFEEPYYRLSTDDVRLGIKADFVDGFYMIEAINLDPYKTEEQKEEEKEMILKQMEGDIIRFTDKGQFVVFTFGIPITTKQSSLLTYSLSYFTDGSVEISSIDTDYWYGDKEISYPDNSKTIAKPFWTGRNEFLDIVGLTPGIISVEPFHTFLWKFVKDRNQGKIFVSDLEKSWHEFRNNGSKWQLNDFQMASIYLTYYFGVPVNVFPSAAALLQGKYIDTLVKYVGRCHLFTFEWIDFNNVDPDPSTGGFSYDYSYDYDFLNLLNIEESVFNITEIPASNCSAFKPHGWRFLAYPDVLSIIRPEEDNPPQAKMYTGYTLRDIRNYSNLSPFFMCEVVIHEIGHAVDAYGINAYRKRFSDMPEWLDIAGWDVNQEYDPTTAKIPKDGYSNTLPDGREVPVSGYGTVDRREDFAETYRMYIINPAFLRDFFPRRFAFMEKYIKTLKPVKEAEHCAIRDICKKQKLWVCR